jgi:MFS family permease
MQENEPSLQKSGDTRMGFHRLIRAFEVVQFRWFWFSIFFSSMSMGVRMLAQGWLVLEMTNSPFWVGAVAGLQGMGLVGFGVFGGTIVDRFDKRKILAMVHLIGGVITLLTGVLIIADYIELWHMLIIALIQGLLMATQLPASNSLAYHIVGPQRLLNALATRLAAMNMSRIIGALIAGVLITRYGVGSSYLFAASGSFLGLGFLWFVKGNFQVFDQRQPFLQATIQGLKYIWMATNIRGLLLLSLFMEAFGFSHLVMMPVMARDVLDVGATGLGYLSAASGIGSTLATLAVASLGDFKNKGALLSVTACCAGISLVLFAFSPWFAVSLVMVALAGGFLMAYDVIMGTMLQLISRNDMRGRVMGVYGLTFGFTPVGGFFTGSVAAILSAPIAVAAGGVIIALYVASMFRFIARINPRA